MRPIRVTTPGAAPALPLRMVAAGTGAITPISLWVLGEGRYEPENFPSFQVDPTALVWNWDEQKSNYSDLRQAGFAASDGAGWILEAGEPTGSWMFQQLVDTANWDPIGSGYADETGEKAVENAEADVTTLLTGINENSLWISRMSAELARAALGQDLALQASSDQATIQRFFEAQNAVGTPPACPPQPECPDGGIDDVAGDPFGDSGDDVLGDSSNCTASGTTDATGGGLVGLALALGAGAVLRRRRRA
jgi:LPXTG-motif cell wall-anchored protein